MASNQTENFGLNQWGPGDQVVREEFNQDNAKIDGALAGKGNCRIVTGSYQGTGTVGAQAPNEIVLPFVPEIVFLSNGDICGVLMAPHSAGTIHLGQIYTVWTLTWEGTTLRWYARYVQHTNGSSGGDPKAEYQFNSAGKAYRYIAIGAQGGVT